MTKNLVARNTEQDLRTAYLLAFDNFSTTPVEVGDAVKGNSRYGRELLGTLVHGGIVCDTRVNGDEMVWQCTETYDNTERETAIETFENWLNSRTPEAPKAKAVLPAWAHGCRCNCGFPTNNPKSNYLPGHDARHAGIVGRAILAGGNKAELLATLPTEALRAKAANMTGKKARKANRPADVVPTQGNVRIGRWVYAATKTGEVVEYTTKKGESKTANAEQAARFVPAS